VGEGYHFSKAADTVAMPIIYYYYYKATMIDCLVEEQASM